MLGLPQSVSESCVYVIHSIHHKLTNSNSLLTLSLRYGPYLYDELPDECYGVYNFDLLPFCDVQKLPECIALAKCVHLLLDGDIMSYKFGYVKKMIESGTIFDIRDVALFNEERWEDARSARRRKEMLIRLYLQGEKRMSGGCYMCCEPFDDRPLKDFPGLHGHHLKEDKKDMNPSQGACWSIVSKVIDRLRGRGLELSWFAAAVESIRRLSLSVASVTCM